MRRVTMRFRLPLVALTALGLVGVADAGRYEANWRSLDGRPTPKWWCDAKFGIFVHWGIYSVPAFAPTDGSDVDLCYAS